MTGTTRRRKQEWKIGDLFLVELEDGSFACGQIVGREPRALNSVTVALFDRRCESASSASIRDCSREHVVSALFVTRDLLDDGVWRVVGSASPVLSGSELPYEETRARGFVGAKIIGSGIATRFLNAFHGLGPWDPMKDPLYFDKLLIDPTLKPAKLLYKLDLRL